ncbi:MAG: hydroxymethylpyrimidine/phosphomethylpyrimidine kinase [Sedimenticola sp.]|nr:hydroxymethylpyrimidine/phosphomethylpyrimidine kinase [Sedimenticola sp.]
MPTHNKPIVLSISGHDPSGGAGIQADIEAMAAHGCHAATAITCLTIQDSRNVHALIPLSPEQLYRQVETLLQDYQIQAIKIGLIGSAEIAAAIGNLLAKRPGIPVVLDPILAAGGGTELASNQLIQTLMGIIVPRTTLITPNSQEARKLTGEDSLDRCANHLLSKGAEAVLITGTHEASDEVINTLYRSDQPPIQQIWARLDASYHGSGCTIASAIAAGLAKGHPLLEAVTRAQEYTWNSLKSGWKPGKGQHIPNRFFTPPTSE